MAEKPGIGSNAADHEFDQDGDLITAGSANAYTVKTARRILGNYRGLRFCARASFTNSAAATMQVDEAPAIPIRKAGNVALTGGEIISGQYYDFIYDDANDVWEGIGPFATAFGLSLLSAANAAAALTALGAAGQGKQTIWVPAEAMSGTTSGGNPPLGFLDGGGTIVAPYRAFDATTEEWVYIKIGMPKNWNEGTISVVFYWAHPATATNFNVVWRILPIAYSDADVIGSGSFGSGQVTDTGGTTNALYISPETSGITIGNSPIENDMVIWRIGRLATDGADTLAVDAFLFGIKIFYTTNAANDA